MAALVPPARKHVVRRYAYNDERNRTVAVHTSGILEALRGVYGMVELADEVAGKKRR